MRLISVVKYDLKFQIRHGFYLAYAFVSLVYVILLHFVPAAILEKTAILLIFSDPCALGAFFIGGIIMLERDQHIFENLFVTPFQVKEYLLSKVLTFAFLSTMVGSVIHIAAFGWGMEICLSLLGTALTASLITLIGIGLTVRAKSINYYLLFTSQYMIIFYLPILDYLKIIESPFFMLFPTYGSLLLLDDSIQSITAWKFLYALSILILGILLAFWWAERSFYQRVLLRIGGGEQ